MPDIEGVPYEASGGKVDQATAQALAARHREAASAGVGAASAAIAPVQAQVTALSSRVDSQDAKTLSDSKTYTDQKVAPLATTVAMNAADALTLSNAKTYTDEQLAGVDLGSGIETVFGTVTLDATGEPIREFYTTGATTFSANGTTVQVGAFTAVVWKRDGANTWSWQQVVDGWQTPTPTPDTTAPVAGTLAVSVTDVAASLTVSGATDDRGVTGYAFQVNGGTWSSWQTSPSYTATGLSASTAYQFRHKVRDAAGNETQGTAVSKTTAATPPFDPSDLYPDADVIDTFTGAPDGTVLAGSNEHAWVRRTVEKGGLQWGAWAMPLMPAPNVENTGYLYVTAAKITGGKARGVAMLNLPQTSARIEMDYDVTATGSRATLALAGNETQGVTARVFQAEGLKVFRDDGTELGSTISLSAFGGPTGRLGLTYDAATGKVTVAHDGVEKFTATTTAGLTGTYAAVDAINAGTFDNVAVTYL